MQFTELNLHPALLRAVDSQGYTSPTPIQHMAIPPVLQGKDVLGCAQTGTGKTAAFALPVLQRLMQGERPRGKAPIRALILAPTRELALQILESFQVYGQYTGLHASVLFGGVSQVPQVRALQRGVDILVATPGRLLDLMNQGYVDLRSVRTLILDEADRMLDMGFIHDIRRVCQALPTNRQTLLFSATMSGEVRTLAQGLLQNPTEIAVTPPATTVELIEQSVFMVEQPEKMGLLVHLLDNRNISRALVFARTKHGADKIARHLDRSGITAVAIHGNKSQNNRINALDSFKQGRTRVMVATDIASRGLDIDEVSHVFNFDLPHEPEAYVHRIGRTGRAGSAGEAYSFCATPERDDLRAIQRLVRLQLPTFQAEANGNSFSTQSVSSMPLLPEARGRQQSNPSRRPNPVAVTVKPRARFEEPRREAPRSVEAQPRREAPRSMESQTRREAPRSMESQPRREAPRSVEGQARREAPRSMEAQTRREAPRSMEGQARREAPRSVESQARREAGRAKPLRTAQNSTTDERAERITTTVSIPVSGRDSAPAGTTTPPRRRSRHGNRNTPGTVR